MSGHRRGKNFQRKKVEPQQLVNATHEQRERKSPHLGQFEPWSVLTGHGLGYLFKAWLDLISSTAVQQLLNWSFYRRCGPQDSPHVPLCKTKDLKIKRIVCHMHPFESRYFNKAIFATHQHWAPWHQSREEDLPFLHLHIYTVKCSTNFKLLSMDSKIHLSSGHLPWGRDWWCERDVFLLWIINNPLWN